MQPLNVEPLKSDSLVSADVEICSPIFHHFFALIFKYFRFQGEPLCIFYSRYGICKFGPSCKFDHPMGVFAYNFSASASADSPAVRRLLGSSSANGALSMSSEGLVEGDSVKPPRQMSLLDRRHIPTNDDSIDTEG